MLTGILWKYATGGLAILSLVLLILWKAEQRHSTKVEKRAQYYQSELQRISSEKDEQREISGRNVEKVVRGDPIVKETVRVIREAPLPGNCETPGLETLRNVI